MPPLTAATSPGPGASAPAASPVTPPKGASKRDPVELADLVDLAARHLGGGVMAASDDSFGAKEALLRPGPVRFTPGTYDHKGEVVDGWETRRRRTTGADWVVVRLGLPGIVRWLDIDTSSFTGNAPVRSWVQGCALGGHPGVAELTDWQDLLPATALTADAHNLLAVHDPHRWTHLRLWADPDGGIGRLRVYGEPVLDPRLIDGLTVDLAGAELGARIVACTDDFYSAADALLRPDQPRTMGEGWETRRRRGPGFDAVVVRLGLAGAPTLIEVDTTCFVHNASASCTVWTMVSEQDPPVDDPGWTQVLGSTALQPDTRHRFRVSGSPATHLRLDAHPDGGLARLRVLGTVDPHARERAGLRWLAALPAAHARAEGIPGPAGPFADPAALRAAAPELAKSVLGG